MIKKALCRSERFLLQPPSLTRRNRFNKFILPKLQTTSSSPSLTMSDAPAANVTENGVPSVTQETVEETPGFKVGSTFVLIDVAIAHHFASSLRT